MEFIVIAVVFGLATGAIGAIKGGSFWIWLLIGVALPGIGILAALFMRREHNRHQVFGVLAHGRADLAFRAHPTEGRSPTGIDHG